MLEFDQIQHTLIGGSLIFISLVFLFLVKRNNWKVNFIHKSIFLILLIAYLFVPFLNNINASYLKILVFVLNSICLTCAIFKSSHSFSLNRETILLKRIETPVSNKETNTTNEFVLPKFSLPTENAENNTILQEIEKDSKSNFIFNPFYFLSISILGLFLYYLKTYDNDPKNFETVLVQACTLFATDLLLLFVKDRCGRPIVSLQSRISIIIRLVILVLQKKYLFISHIIIYQIFIMVFVQRIFLLLYPKLNSIAMIKTKLKNLFNENPIPKSYLEEEEEEEEEAEEEEGEDQKEDDNEISKTEEKKQEKNNKEAIEAQILKDTNKNDIIVEGNEDQVLKKNSLKIRGFLLLFIVLILTAAIILETYFIEKIEFIDSLEEKKLFIFPLQYLGYFMIWINLVGINFYGAYYIHTLDSKKKFQSFFYIFVGIVITILGAVLFEVETNLNKIWSISPVVIILITVSSLSEFKLWISRDYDLLIDLEHDPHLDKSVKQSGFMFYLVNILKNIYTLIAFFLPITLFIVIEGVLEFRFKEYYNYKITLILGTISLMFLTFILIKKWFNTFAFDLFTNLLIVTGILILGYSCYKLWFDLQNDSQQHIIHFSLLSIIILYPTFILFSISIYKIYDDGWKYTKSSKIFLTICSIIFLLFIVTMMILLPQSIKYGIFLIYLWITKIILLYSINIWIKNNHYWKSSYSKKLLFAMTVLTIALSTMLYYATNDLFYPIIIGFIIFSLIFLFITILQLSMNGTQSKSQNNVFYSQNFFPIYRFTFSKDLIVEQNILGVLVVITFLFIYSIGLILVIFIQNEELSYYGFIINLFPIIFLIDFMYNKIILTKTQLFNSLKYLNDEIFLKTIKKNLFKHFEIRPQLLHFSNKIKKIIQKSKDTDGNGDDDGDADTNTDGEGEDKSGEKKKEKKNFWVLFEQFLSKYDNNANERNKWEIIFKKINNLDNKIKTNKLELKSLEKNSQEYNSLLKDIKVLNKQKQSSLKQINYFYFNLLGSIFQTSNLILKHNLSEFNRYLTKIGYDDLTFDQIRNWKMKELIEFRKRVLKYLAISKSQKIVERRRRKQGIRAAQKRLLLQEQKKRALLFKVKEQMFKISKSRFFNKNNSSLNQKKDQEKEEKIIPDNFENKEESNRDIEQVNVEETQQGEQGFFQRHKRDNKEKTIRNIKPSNRKTEKAKAFMGPYNVSHASQEELDKIILDIENEVKHSNKKFVDRSFPHNLTSLCGKVSKVPSKFYKVAQWRRPFTSKKNETVSLFKDGFDPSDIRQGMLGDCYLLSSLSVLTLHPKLMENIFVYSKNEKYGFFIVKLFFNDKWEYVLIDDYFPCKSNLKSAFGHSNDPLELWVQVLEKAYAKIFGSYMAIEGGFVHLALSNLSGGVPELIEMQKKEVVEQIQNGQLWIKLLNYHHNEFLIGTGSNAGSDTNLSKGGIVKGHAYSILNVVEIDGHQLLQLRNPWGDTEWNGDWSDKSPLWTKRLKVKLGWKDEDDGTFWMSFQDFVKEYRNLYVCKLFPNSWSSVTFAGKWKGETAGGCLNFKDSCYKNPHYLLSIDMPTHCYITLTQQPPKGVKNFNMGVWLIKNGGKRVKRLYVGQKVATSGNYVAYKTVVCQVKLEPLNEPYTVFISTFKQGEEADFTISVKSDQKIKFEELKGDLN
ncbi:calpain-15 [Anaeramoeba flamelloides]|uniref:Calpain-15 n=1 Tax=Anaeramoeba flamelloides TaxID=1746091 RepID=A0ABQ8YE40_9EUKA|nr:calpain-15 [Anaeramoeba flamelloides]